MRCSAREASVSCTGANELPAYLGGTDPGAIANNAGRAVELLLAALPEPIEITYRRPANLREEDRRALDRWLNQLQAG